MDNIFKKIADFNFFQIYSETKVTNIIDDFKDEFTTNEIEKSINNKLKNMLFINNTYQYQL